MRLDTLERVSRRACFAVTLIALAWLALSTVGAGAQPAGAPALTVTAPRSDETIHDNNGTLAVTVSLQGAALGEGRRLRALIDGQPYGGDQSTLGFSLNDIDRGEHTLQVQLIDANGVVLATSIPVRFHMWRASALSPLSPPRKPAPPPAK
jgi:hypothetical protein